MELTPNRRQPADGSYAHTQSVGAFFMSPRKPPDDLLTDGQRRHVIASLASVATALAEIQTIGAETDVPCRSPLDVMRRDLPNGFARAAGFHVMRAYDALSELIDILDLEARETSAFRAVQALVVSSLVVLEDTATRNLKGYGPIHPALTQTLEPALNRLHEEVAAIGEILASLPDEAAVKAPPL